MYTTNTPQLFVCKKYKSCLTNRLSPSCSKVIKAFTLPPFPWYAAHLLKYTVFTSSHYLIQVGSVPSCSISSMNSKLNSSASQDVWWPTRPNTFKLTWQVSCVFSSIPIRMTNCIKSVHIPSFLRLTQSDKGKKYSGRAMIVWIQVVFKTIYTMERNWLILADQESAMIFSHITKGHSCQDSEVFEDAYSVWWICSSLLPVPNNAIGFILLSAKIRERLSACWIKSVSCRVKQWVQSVGSILSQAMNWKVWNLKASRSYYFDMFTKFILAQHKFIQHAKKCQGEACRGLLRIWTQITFILTFYCMPIPFLAE